MSTDFKPGELLDIAFRAELVDASGPHWRFKTVGGELYIAAELAQAANLTRALPAEWPPEPGDIWADANGAEWFARRGSASDTTVYFDSARAGFVSEDPAHILALDGPLRLVRRANEDIARGGGGVGAPSGGMGAPTGTDEDPLPRLVQPAPITDPALVDPPVWVATQRQGIDHHAFAGNMTTGCGRSTTNGVTITQASADELHTRPCPRCYPGGAS